MAQSTIQIKIKCDTRPFKKYVRKTMLQLWKSAFGLRRFFMIDWWRLKLGLKIMPISRQSEED